MGVYWVASNSVSLLGEVSCRGGGGGFGAMVVDGGLMWRVEG